MGLNSRVVESMIGLLGNLIFTRHMQLMEFTTGMCHTAYFDNCVIFELCLITTVIITDQLTLSAFEEIFGMLTCLALL